MSLLILLFGKPLLAVAGLAGWTMTYRFQAAEADFAVEARAAIEEVEIVPNDPARVEIAPDAAVEPPVIEEPIPAAPNDDNGPDPARDE